VETDSGPVHLTDLESLKSRIDSRRGEVNARAEQARSLRALADDRYAELGQLLVDNSTQWPAQPMVSPLVEQARSLRSRIDTDEATMTSIHEKERHGLAGLMNRVGDWNDARKAGKDRASLEPQLRGLLIHIAQSAPLVDLEPASNVRYQAQAAINQALALEAEVKSASEQLAALDEERMRRESAQHDMGFDAPYLAAYLKTYGPPPVESALNLKRGERALAVMPASLARQQTRTRWVGASQGVSFPIGHTGIRYRVGSYHGHPIQQQVLTTIDSGSLEITNQRLAFIGGVKSTSVWLEKILHVESYSDALAIFREGRENPDFFLMVRPQYALFMLNWATASAS
jgi:hypothetical protein